METPFTRRNEENVKDTRESTKGGKKELLSGALVMQP
jgi:hypothetical protein